MGVIYYMLRPYELRSILQWKVFHDPVHQRDPKKETIEQRECFRLLDLTSRSFSTVIQELNHELLLPITLFYLVLRGLDTVEDDMTIPLQKKLPILRNFHKTMLVDGWTFHESKEKDRELLEKFHYIVTELKKLKEPYLDVIKEMTEKMGNGMADYCSNAHVIQNGLDTIDDYELYCHYVAGLVGEGLTKLFLSAELCHPKLAERPSLTESMGQFLQKLNIIRDIHEDHVDGRRWYPKEIWGKHVTQWEHMFDPKYEEQALNVVSEMVLDALKHVEECLFYMAGLRDQSVFNFVAIPQGMAIATLEKVFRNPDVLKKNVKITKGDACQVMIESTQNLYLECEVFRKYVRKIQKKNDPRDPNYLNISVQCGKIEQFIESLFPKQDPKKLVLSNQEKQKKEPDTDPAETAVIFGVAMLCILFMAALMIGIAWAFGASWSHVFDDIKPFIGDILPSVLVPGSASRDSSPLTSHNEL